MFGAASILGASLLAAAPAWAGTTNVRVDLTDASADSQTSGMVMRSDHATVKAGKVMFLVRNASKSLVHEMLVILLGPPATALPYDTAGNKVDEDAIHSLGEVEELRPGAHGSLTLALRPGTYRLMCNQPGHYHAGMYTDLTVTP